MPWRKTDVMDEKEKFIQEMLSGERPFKQLCAEFGISEKTGYKWKKRFMEEGKRGLLERNRAPLSSTNALGEDVVLGLIALKTAHPFWGPKKILELFVKAYPQLDAPSISSVKRVLDKAGLVKKQRVKRAVSDNGARLRNRIIPQQVNDVWAIDFKGWWKSSGEICEPFTVRDLVSRRILCIKLMKSKTSEAVKEVMKELFKKYGLPKVIRSDNGPPFASPNGILSLTSLSAWWITLGIIPDRTKKGCPGQNGSLERMHADLAREIEGKIQGGIQANQAALDAWMHEYNSVRPNEAIGMKTPDELYRASERKYLGDFDEIEYPIGFEQRKVSRSGEITVRGIRIHIGYSLRGLTVGLKPAENNSFDLFLADFPLGLLDMNSCCFFPQDVV